jgi:hypothetical protein
MSPYAFLRKREPPQAVSYNAWLPPTSSRSAKERKLPYGAEGGTRTSDSPLGRQSRIKRGSPALNQLRKAVHAIAQKDMLK